MEVCVGGCVGVGVGVDMEVCVGGCVGVGGWVDMEVCVHVCACVLIYTLRVSAVVPRPLVISDCH